MEWEWVWKLLSSSFRKQQDYFDYYQFYYYQEPISGRKYLSSSTSSAISNHAPSQKRRYDDLKSYQPGRISINDDTSKIKRSNTLRLIIVSDTHEFHDDLNLPPCDVLIHGGDVLINSSKRSSFYNHCMLYSFGRWFQRQPARYHLLVPGNHDEAFVNMSPAQISTYLTPQTTLLCNSGLHIDGMSIWGSPLSSGTSSNRAFQSPQFSVETHEAAQTVAGNVDILITHGHCVEIRDIVLPRLMHIMGHLHEHHGVHVLNGEKDEKEALVVAAGPLINMEYLPKNPPIVVDLILLEDDGMEKEE
eukprot:gene4757-5214_t